MKVARRGGAAAPAFAALAACPRRLVRCTWVADIIRVTGQRPNGRNAAAAPLHGAVGSDALTRSQCSFLQRYPRAPLRVGACFIATGAILCGGPDKLRSLAAAACAARQHMGVVYQAPHRAFSCSVIAPSAPCSARYSSSCPSRTPAQPRTAVERQRGARRGAALAARPRGLMLALLCLRRLWWSAWVADGCCAGQEQENITVLLRWCSMCWWHQALSNARAVYVSSSWRFFSWFVFVRCV